MSTTRWSRDVETLVNFPARSPEEGDTRAPSRPPPSPSPALSSAQTLYEEDPHGRHSTSPQGLGLDYPVLHHLPTVVDEDEMQSMEHLTPSATGPSFESQDERVMSAANYNTARPLWFEPNLKARPVDEQEEYDNIEMGQAPVQRPTIAPNRTPIFGQFYDLKPLLVRRHILMISISGSVGMGIFVTSGQILQLAGSFGALLVYAFTGLVVYCVMACLGEMVALIPEAGALQEYPTRFVDDALGWTVAISYWFTYAMGVATLTTSTAMFVAYWGDDFQVGWVITIILIVVIIINVFGVRLYGEIEYVSGLLKVTLVVGLVILMLFINRGAGPTGRVHGVEYWQQQCRFSNRFPTNSSATDVKQWSCTDTVNPRPPFSAEISGSMGEFLSIWKGLTLAIFSFIGVELVAVTASEAKYPRDDLPNATRRIFWLTFGLYLAAIFFVSLNVPYSEWQLSPSAAPSRSSPFIIAIKEAGIKVLPGFVNGAMLFASWSTTNTQLFVASRTLYGMAARVSAETHPWLSVLSRTTKQGVPMTAIFVSCIFTPLAYLQCGKQSAKDLLNILSQIQTVACLVVWMLQCLSFIRFYNGLQAGGAPYDRMSDDYPYCSLFQPWTAYFGFVCCGLLALFNGFDVFIIKPWSFEWKYFLADYLAPVLVIVAYALIKLIWRKPFVSYSKMRYSVRRENFDRRRGSAEDQSRLRRFLGWIFG